MTAAHPAPPAGAPLVIGHRGACGYVPEHTLASYFIAMQQGADYIEPDLVATRDGVLIARHENEIGATTDVGTHPEFAARRTVRRIDGVEVRGWFTEDFTLAELKRLKARERIPAIRPGSARFDDQFEIPTFEEILALLVAQNAQRASAARALGAPAPPPVGVYPEMKHPSHFAALGLPLEEPLLELLASYGCDAGAAPVFLQSFEVGNLQRLRERTRLPLVQLVAAAGAPYDLARAGDARTYADLTSERGLNEVRRYADVIGVDKSLVIARTAQGALAAPSTLTARAHQAGLAVHAWTFRAESEFLPAGLGAAGDPTALGDMAGELAAYFAAGIDGFFTDQPLLGVRARAAFLARSDAPAG